MAPTHMLGIRRKFNMAKPKSSFFPLETCVFQLLVTGCKPKGPIESNVSLLVCVKESDFRISFCWPFISQLV